MSVSVLPFGIINTRLETETIPVLGASFSIVGICTTGVGSDAAVLPAMTALRFASSDPVLLAAAKGLLGDALRGINDQLGQMQQAADVIIVRVNAGQSEAETIQNVCDGLDVMRGAPEIVAATPRILICPGFTTQTTSYGGEITVNAAASRQGGNHGNGTLTLAGTPWLAGVRDGVYKVEVNGGTTTATSAAKAGGNTGTGVVGSLTADLNSPLGDWLVTCAIPTPMASIWSVLRPDGSLDGIAVEGSAYNSTNGPTFTIGSHAEGGVDYAAADRFVLTVKHSVPAGGGTFTVAGPDSLALANGTVGTPYAQELAFTMAAGVTDFEVGDGWDVTVNIVNPTVEANAVTVKLEEICTYLLAVAFCDTPDTTMLAAQNWRETVQSDRIIPCGVSVRVLEDAEVVNRPMSPRIAGLAVRIDHDVGAGTPFNPIANRPIWGIVGTSRPIRFSLTDPAVEGQVMLDSSIGIIVRGELGVDWSIADGGFVYIGTEGCAPSQLWAQFHQVRGTDYITVEMMRITRTFLGRMITADMAEAWLNSLKFCLRDHKSADQILGYQVKFTRDRNSPEEVRLGHLLVNVAIEPAPAFRQATHEIARYRPAVDALVSDIIARLDQSGP